MRRVVGLLAALVVTGGCAFGEILADYGEPVDMRPSDLVGTGHSNADRSITFNKDGTFSAAELPYGVFDSFLPDDFDPASDVVDGSGTWALEATNENPDGPNAAVVLSFQWLASEETALGVDMTALRKDRVVALVFFYIGDRGNGWTAYQKCAPDCEE